MLSMRTTVAAVVSVVVMLGIAEASLAARPLKAVFLDSGRDLSFCKGDGTELWRFRCPRGEFYRSGSMGASRVVKKSQFLVVDSTTTLYGLNATTGKLRWSFDLPHSSPLVRLSNLIVTSDQVLLSTNQIGNPLICLDGATGKVAWQYPAEDKAAAGAAKPEQLGFYELVIRDAMVLVRVAATRDSRRGYKYENRALDLKTGRRLEWPDRYKKVPASGRGRLDHVFAGKQLAPVHKGNMFTGVLKRSAAGDFYFHRPRFYGGSPHYEFVTNNPNELRALVDKRVAITGEVLSVAESAPPQYRVRVRSVKKVGG